MVQFNELSVSPDAKTMTIEPNTKYKERLAAAELFAKETKAGFWGTVEPVPGAAEALQRLMKKGHDLYIVTATEYEHLYEKMQDLLFRYFPFLTWSHVIITSRKQMIRGDVLIDDGPHNLIGGAYKKILFDAPHNRDFDAEANGMVRVHDWAEVERVIEKLESITEEP